METTAVGYADNATLLLPYSTFLGESVGSSSLLLRYTIVGDADLNGKVNDDDAGLLGLWYDNGATTGHHWQEGDFDFSGTVDDNDAGLLGLFYGMTVPGYAGI